MTQERVIVESAYSLACSLPSSTVEALAAAILTCSDGSLRAEITKRVPHHHHRDMALAFVDRWRSEVNDIDARTVAVALQSAALSEQTHRDSQSVELVWTGPDTEDTPFRRTEQAILQVLDSAKTRITLVSFAVYRIPNIGKALVRAAKRGVRLTVIIETPDKIEGQSEYSTIRALGQEVAACSTVYFWPQREPACWRKQQGRHLACEMCGGGRRMVVPLIGQPDSASIHDQHGIGNAGPGWDDAGSG